MDYKAQILIVDDEPHSLFLTSRVLQKAGYETLEASTGQEGLQLASQERPDLVLLDVMLPDINGIELCKRIKTQARAARTFVILLSASAITSELQASGLEAGADGYVARPVSNRELLARVEAMLRLKKTAETLQQYETVVSTVPDPMSYVDRNYVYRLVNEAYARYAKLPEEKIVGLSVAELLGTELFEKQVKPHLDRCFAGERVHYQAWFDVPGEAPRFMDVSYSPVFDEDGADADHPSVMSVAVASRDITAQKQTEDALQRERDLVAQIMEMSPVGIVVLDRDGRINFANAQIEKLTGLTRTQIIQANYSDPRWRVVDDDSRTVPNEMLPFPQVMHSKQPLYGLEHAIELADRQRLFLSINAAPLFGKSGELSSVVMTVEDVTERKRTEQALVDSRQFFQSALDALSANIAVLDQVGEIVAVNASWRRFGQENGLVWQDDGIGRNYLAILDAPSAATSSDATEAARGIRDVIAGQRDHYLQEYPCHSPTEQRWYAMSVTRFESCEGVRAVVSHENVTERKLAEIALREAKEAAEHAQQEAVAARKEEEKRRRIAESLRDILAILNSNRPLAEVLDYIVAQAGQLLGSQAVAIYRIDQESGQLALQAAQGLAEHDQLGKGTENGLYALQEAISVHRPVDVDEIDPSSAYRSLLAVPIAIKEEIYGGMLLYYADPHEFPADEIELAVLFGDQVALAIENARLRDEVGQAAVAAERSRLARDLHDAVTQTLFSASVIAESIPRIWDRYPDEARRGLEELQQLTRGALAEMRTLLLELRPAALIEKPLGELLRHLTEAVTSRTRVPIELAVEEEASLPPDVQVVLYRIAQEALNNVAKHAAASQVTVELHASPAQATLRVHDNGRGFDLDTIPPGHLGVGIMHERAESVGIAFKIDSRAGYGTEITAEWQVRGGLDDRV
ncbi:MAG: PAS domain-containing protein [Anaerolineae bacterium]|nr:PAS domain-containing protein [Anaerolineae bacterium]